MRSQFALLQVCVQLQAVLRLSVILGETSEDARLRWVAHRVVLVRVFALEDIGAAPRFVAGLVAAGEGPEAARVLVVAAWPGAGGLVSQVLVELLAAVRSSRRQA